MGSEISLRGIPCSLIIDGGGGVFINLNNQRFHLNVSENS